MYTLCGGQNQSTTCIRSDMGESKVYGPEYKKIFKQKYKT